MKKLTTVLIAAGLLASASACSAPQLTTAQTCDRMAAAASGLTQESNKTATNRVANAIRPIQAVASDEMKPVVTSILDFLDEQAKSDPDEAKLGELTTAYQEAGTKYGELCRGAQ
ncbi:MULTISPECIES: hypothetical protein [Paenarthrobacter]|jgi:hypothetical protein|uniref:hypothetical protein n=1 Tax=Paenarthrobacter TaxID=1742992 RepID=UPI0018787783|nr:MULTISPECIES: hypothetical protein [Paenarthrobacter]MBN9131259.1 hypothetical protein [Paenarthrobacter ureafaciens]QOT15691.1 hypothetical protein HMI59_03210 [Paenarthrobacter sp. YJN-5]QQQ63416.1 hypothetical protein JHQ56_06275 [Paenarthrobacter ureafaciens]UOD80780.1 hypothetical protein MQZ73_16950 [Paenarthrobacter ureafaciens]WNZ03439.1 hypothetical protein PVT25_17620 [Paenarthrobacter ureafaciens]